MRSLIFIIFFILIFIFFGGCADIKDEAPKFRNLTLNLFKNDSNSRNLRTNEDITLGIQRELIKVVQESEIFSKEPSKLTKIYDSNSTNLSTNEVSLSIPLGIPVKLFAYRYQEDFGTIQNEITTNIPVSFGKSNTFILKEDTKSLTINLEISPNGIPGLIVEKNDNITSDGGGTSSFQISLKTHPTADVTISINTNFSGVVLSQKNLEFTPLNWSIPQKIYLTGIENSLIKKSQDYNVIIGGIISYDFDYSKIVTNDLIFHHQIVSKPILKDTSKELINLNAETVSFKATINNTLQLPDNESDLGTLLNFKEPTFILGRDSKNNSREWISSDLKGNEFMTYIYRDDNQKLTIYALENSNIKIYKGGTEIENDNLSNNLRKEYDLTGVVNETIRIISTGNILITIQGDSGNDFRPLIPMDNEIYSPGNSQYGFILINADTAGIKITESCSDNTTKIFYTESEKKGYIENLSHQDRLYEGSSCVYDVDGNYKIAGSSFADSNGYDSISYLPKNYFQKITPIPFETNYYKVVSNYSSSCSFLSYDNLTIDNFSLEGFGQVFQYYNSDPKPKGVISCINPVMVIAQDNLTDDEINIIIPWME